MPDHTWLCPACKNKNPPFTEACRDCGTFAERPQAEPPALTSLPTPPAPAEIFSADLPADDEPEQGGESFSASKDSQLAKTRRYLLLGLCLGLAISSVQYGRISLFVVFFALLIALPFEFFLRRQLRFGQPLVTLTDQSITAPNLSGSLKRLHWRDIEQVRLDSNQGHRMIAFQVKPGAGLPAGKSFWTGLDASKPMLGLAAFSPADQERLLDAIRLRHRQAAGDAATEAAPQTNELREEREFQDRIKALQPQTWLTYALVGANVLVWLLTLLYGATFLQTPADKLLAWGGNSASEVQKGEWWRLLTATFLHSGFLHVTMNMIGLFTAGVMVERIYGRRLFLIVYFGSGLLGSALSLHFSAQQVVSVGASGAVFGVAGALLVAVYQHRDALPKHFSKQMMSGLGFFVLYSLLQGFTKTNIDNAAHVGGLLGGCLAALVLPERFNPGHYHKTFSRRALAALAILGVATGGLAAMAPTATLDQARLFASVAVMNHATQEFDLTIKAIQQEESERKAGKLTELDVDQRGRSIHAPRLRRVAQELSQVVLRPGDPRVPMLKELRTMSELMAETGEMSSVVNETTGKIEPTDPARMEKLGAEIKASDERLRKAIQAVKKPQ